MLDLQFPQRTIVMILRLDFLKSFAQKQNLVAGHHLIGLHILMEESTAVKIKNMIENIMAGHIAPVEIIA